MTAPAESVPQAGSPLTGGEILQNARALSDRVRDKDLAAEYDRLRHMPEDIVAEIRAAGVMRMNMPKIWGGPEMTAMEQVEVIEALARADASIAWCSFIWCDSGIYSGVSVRAERDRDESPARLAGRRPSSPEMRAGRNGVNIEL